MKVKHIETLLEGLTIKDITKKWIINNFNIEQESKTIGGCEQVTLLRLDELEKIESESIDSFCEKLKEQLKHQDITVPYPICWNITSKKYSFQNSAYYDDYEFKCILSIEYERSEFLEETISRLQNKVKKLIKQKKYSTYLKIKEEERKREEFELYKQLQEKFKDNNEETS